MRLDDRDVEAGGAVFCEVYLNEINNRRKSSGKA